LFFFLLRTGTRGAPSCKVNAGMACTPFPPWNHHLPASCLSVPSNLLRSSGMLVWVTPLSRLSVVLSSNNLPFVSHWNSVSHVCDAYQQAKSHQLPFPKFVSISMASLELVFSDVWSPAPTSVGKNNYYVSFIDDFSKFTWVYLLKHKSKVFQKFQDFQARVERLFDQKLLAMQTN
jgi:hypothetical protein